MDRTTDNQVDDTSAELKEDVELKTDDTDMNDNDQEFSDFNDDHIRLRPIRIVKQTDGCKILCKKIFNRIRSLFQKCGLCQDQYGDSMLQSPPNRHIYYGPKHDVKNINNEWELRQPHLDEEDNSAFTSNYISTQKYNIYTFIPVNLFEQFRRVANMYFLFIAILATTPISPKDPVFTIFPLCSVLAISAVKEAYEDYQRYKQDKEVNNRTSIIYRPDSDNNGKDWKFREVLWKYIEVGDIIKVDKKHPFFPADMLLLQSSKNQGLCNIETSNLDGETNLKIKQAVGATYSIQSDENGDKYPCQKKLQFKLESEAPNERLNEWQGTLCFDENKDDAISLSINQLLIRGCTLRNTDWIIGLVIYTGKESKLSLNNRESPLKRSHVDTLVDYAIYCIFITQFCLCVFGVIAHYLFLRNQSWKYWYQYINPDGSHDDRIVGRAFSNYFTFMVLLDTVVPISLYVSIEVVKFIQVWPINNDNAMTYKDPDDETIIIKPQARTSNLNEELGQVSFIFSDKTGTLTQNKMEFLKCHIGITRYGQNEMESQDDICERIDTPKDMKPFNVKECRFTDNRVAARSQNDNNINEFMTLLTTCHNIIPEHPDGPDGPIVYNAASPDEKALVIFAKNMHYEFYEGHVRIIEIRDKKIDGHRFYIKIFGDKYEFDIYNMLEFTSKRKRMSVITKDPRDNKFKIYIKGADNVIYQRLTEASKKEEWESTLESIKLFAEEGLRTLVCAYKEISEDEYYEWLKELIIAKASLENRKIKIEQIYNKIEQGFTLLGATAIEDKLQEGVDVSINDFTIAGISLWVLTGDKVETAINIGKSAKLLKPKMNVTVIDPNEKLNYQDTNKTVIQEFDKANEYLKYVDMNSDKHGLVISGKALSVVFPARKHTIDGKEIPPTMDEQKHEEIMQEKFLRMCLHCRAVLCCRVSPIQKAQVVKLVRSNVKNIITLAIGDGANDVPMIRAAHVGIGISGQEGLQAVMASDYSIAQFKYLKELLFVHGAWNYRRISILILYTFHKTICFCLIQVWYSIYNGYSGTLFYDDFSGSIITLVFLNFPALSLGILDRHYSKEIARLCPELYTIGIQNGYFSTKIFLRWCLEALILSLLIFYLNVFFLDSSLLKDGKAVGFWVSATTQFTSIIMVLTMRIMLETKTWTAWTWIWLIFSIASWFLFTIVWSVLPLTWFTRHFDVYYASIVMMGMPQFWLTIILNTVTCMLPIMLYSFVKQWYCPTRQDIIEELEVLNDKRNKFIDKLTNKAKPHLQPIQSKSLEIKSSKDVF